MPLAHAKLGPSASDRWLYCTKSVELIDWLVAKGVIELGGSSIFADEGTAAHTIREDCLQIDLDAYDFIGRNVEVNGNYYECDEEMARFLQPGIDWIREHCDEPHTEVRVDLSAWLPEQFGTMDAGWYDELDKTLYLSDLKYGQGEDVDPEENNQQLLYALGLWDYLGRPEVEKVIICIDQPRLGGLKFWETDFNRLMVFADQVVSAYDEIQLGTGKFYPSKKGCRWCPARDAVPEHGYMGCTAYNDWMYEFFADAFDDLDDEEGPQVNMDPARRYEIVRHAKEITKWLAKLHEASLEAAMYGNPDPGSKAVIGQKGNRYFTDEEEAEMLLISALGTGAYQPRKMIGIPDAEKVLKPRRGKPGNPAVWEALEQLVDQPDGKPILVPVTDKREEIKPLADQFDDLP